MLTHLISIFSVIFPFCKINRTGQIGSSGRLVVAYVWHPCSKLFVDGLWLKRYQQNSQNLNLEVWFNMLLKPRVIFFVGTAQIMDIMLTQLSHLAQLVSTPDTCPFTLTLHLGLDFNKNPGDVVVELLRISWF